MNFFQNAKMVLLDDWGAAASEVYMGIRDGVDIAMTQLRDGIRDVTDEFQRVSDTLPAEVARQSTERERVRTWVDEMREQPQNSGFSETELTEMDVNMTTSELLHELPEMEGQIGLPENALSTEAGLQNTLQRLTDAQWEDEMKAAEVDTSLLDNLQSSRNFVERTNIELQEILPTGQSVASQMQGTRITPLDVELSRNIQPESMNLLETRVELAELPMPARSEITQLEPMDVTPFSYEYYQNVQAEMDTGDLWGDEPEAAPDMIEMENIRVEMDEILPEIYDQESMGIRPFEVEAPEIPPMEELSGALESGALESMLATVSETADFLLKFSLEGIVYSAPIFLVEELIPIFTSVAEGTWNKPKSYKETLKHQAIVSAQLDSVFGKSRRAAQQITDHYKKNETYVWVRDNGIAGAEKQSSYTLSDFISQRILTGTGLWKRCRILTLEGDAVLQDDLKKGYWFYLKPTSSAHTDDRSFTMNASGGFAEQGFFFHLPNDGKLLKDTPENRSRCFFYNLWLLNKMLPKLQTAKEVPLTGDADILDRLQIPGKTSGDWTFTDSWDRGSVSSDVVEIIPMNTEFKSGDRVVFRKPRGERVHGKITGRSGFMKYFFKADNPTRTAGPIVEVQFDSVSREGPRYLDKIALLEKRDRLKERKEENYKEYLARIKAKDVKIMRQDGTDTKAALRARINALNQIAGEVALPPDEIETQQIIYIEGDWPFSQIQKDKVSPPKVPKVVSGPSEKIKENPFNFQFRRRLPEEEKLDIADFAAKLSLADDMVEQVRTNAGIVGNQKTVHFCTEYQGDVEHPLRSAIRRSIAELTAAVDTPKSLDDLPITRQLISGTDIDPDSGPDNAQDIARMIQSKGQVLFEPFYRWKDPFENILSFATQSDDLLKLLSSDIKTPQEQKSFEALGPVFRAFGQEWIKKLHEAKAPVGGWQEDISTTAPRQFWDYDVGPWELSEEDQETIFKLIGKPSIDTMPEYLQVFDSESGNKFNVLSSWQRARHAPSTPGAESSTSSGSNGLVIVGALVLVIYLISK